MAYNETGHARNVANFQELVMVVKTMGNAYNPVAKAIQIPQLEELVKQLQTNLQAVNEKNGVYRDKIYNRQTSYEQMSELAMRIVNTVVGLGLDAKILTQAKSTLAKIRGGGKKKKTEPTLSGETPAKTNSVSQMSFDQRKNNFDILAKLVSAQANYKPNKTDMQVGSLQDYVNSLENFNNEANQAEQDLTIARQQRDMLLYTENSGAMTLVQQIKGYIKGDFGVKSAEFERVKGIKFNNIKINI
jgi:pyocin large subunit-like protein